VGPDGPTDIALPDSFAVPSGKEAIEKGAAVFIAKGCGGCHKFEDKLVGPPLAGLGERRTDAWIAKMILHPEDMTKKDPVARDMYRSIMTQMTNQGVGPDEIGPLIAYLKSGGKE
jgi:cytochrome c2